MEVSEQALYRAVIKRAYDDLFFPLTAECDSMNARRDADAAREFLTATFGEGCRDREFICEMADVCPDAVRDRVLMCLARKEAGLKVTDLRFSGRKSEIDRTEQKPDTPDLRTYATEDVKHRLAAIAAG